MLESNLRSNTFNSQAMTKRVLIIDDETAIQDVIQGCLEDIAGWKVFKAKSGRDGLSIAESEQPDAILLDVSMPDMDGVETFQRLQGNPATSYIPVAFLTARVQPEDKARFKQLGIAGLIVKPFNAITLIEDIANLFKWDQ